MADDVVHLITRDHRALEALFEQLRSDKGSREEVLEQVAAMLVAHSRAEEEEVYPSLARAEPGMEREVHHGKEEHEQAERLLHELEATAPPARSSTCCSRSSSPRSCTTSRRRRTSSCRRSRRP
jgi:hemerythrin superfamily protein